MMMETVSFQVYNDSLEIGLSVENHNEATKMKELHANLPLMFHRIDEEHN